MPDPVGEDLEAFGVASDQERVGAEAHHGPGAADLLEEGEGVLATLAGLEPADDATWCQRGGRGCDGGVHGWRVPVAGNALGGVVYAAQKARTTL